MVKKGIMLGTAAMVLLGLLFGRAHSSGHGQVGDEATSHAPIADHPLAIALAVTARSGPKSAAAHSGNAGVRGGGRNRGIAACLT